MPNKADEVKDNIKIEDSIIKVMMMLIKIVIVFTPIEDVLQDSANVYPHHPIIAIKEIDE